MDVKINMKENWADLWVDGKFIGYIYIDDEGELVVHLYKDKIGSLSAS